MAKLTKRQKLISEKVDTEKLYGAVEAFGLLKDLPPVKFTESVDVSINLGVDAKKSDQAVRGSTVLPNGTGKTVRVAVFTQGDNVEAAKAAGADIVGPLHFSRLHTKNSSSTSSDIRISPIFIISSV